MGNHRNRISALMKSRKTNFYYNSMGTEHNKIKRFIRLDQIFRNPEGHTVQEILADLEDAEKKEMKGDRTLRSYLKEFSESFGAEFDLHAYRGRERLWKYKDSSFSIFNQVNLDVEIIRNAIKNLKVFEGDPRYDMLRYYLLGLEDGVQNTTNIISFDNNMEYTGLQYVEPLAQAIIHKYPIKLTYKPFWGKEKEINIHPYHLRQYNKRWYIFAYCEEQHEIHNYPLDRIVQLEHLSKPYRETDIDFEEYFDEIVGVTNYKNAKIVKVVLKVDKKSVDFIRTKPLHWSQTELKELNSESHSFIQLKLKVNTEFKMLLFSYNDEIEVIEPIWLRDFFAEKIKKMATKYEV